MKLRKTLTPAEANEIMKAHGIRRDDLAAACSCDVRNIFNYLAGKNVTKAFGALLRVLFSVDRKGTPLIVKVTK